VKEDDSSRVLNDLHTIILFSALLVIVAVGVAVGLFLGGGMLLLANIVIKR
jgi:hypothetical protein